MYRPFPQLKEKHIVVKGSDFLTLLLASKVRAGCFMNPSPSLSPGVFNTLQF